MAPKSTTSGKKRRSHIASATEVANCMDLLIEILMRLPARAIIQCKRVSKQWRSIISDPKFIMEYAKRTHKSLPGFVLDGRNNPHPKFFFVSLRGNSRSSNDDPKFLDPEVQIENICNGLLCCSMYVEDAPRFISYCVCNPTSGQLKCIKVLERSEMWRLMGVNFAFDPLKSAFYNLIFVSEVSRSKSEQLIKIDIYSSKTHSWRRSSKGLYIVPYNHVGFRNGVHWNGAIYWYHQWKNTLAYFDFDTDCIVKLETPQLQSAPYEMKIDYMGEAGGRLHLVATCRPMSTLFTIFEMKEDRSGWFAKCRGDFSALITAFPRMVRVEPTRPCYFCVVALFEGEKEEELSIVLKIPGSLIQYNVKDKTSKKLRSLPKGSLRRGI